MEITIIQVAALLSGLGIFLIGASAAAFSVIFWRMTRKRFMLKVWQALRTD